MNDFVEPLGTRILIRKDESRHTTRGGIVLPDQSEIPTITGRVVAISLEMQYEEVFPVKKYDKVLFHPKNAIPVDFESDNLLFVVPAQDVVAVFRKAEARSKDQQNESEKEASEDFDSDFEGFDENAND